jgi:PadR family transcriptional regulator
MVLECLVSMTQKKNKRKKAELLPGTLDMLIMQTLQWGPEHGHGVGLAIRARSGELLDIEAGSLYPSLHRLERQGWINSEWKMSENNQRAKYYRLTSAGRKQLLAEESKWDLLVRAVSRVRRPI